MSEPIPTCSRCQRNLSAEKPVRLPDTRIYCAACCESMAADAFEMETGETFTKWIEKHPELVMRYQPLELSVRRLSFLFPLFVSLIGVGTTIFGIVQALRLGHSPLLAFGFPLTLLASAAIEFAGFKLTLTNKAGRMLGILLMVLGSLAIPASAVASFIWMGRTFGFILLGLVVIGAFGALALRGGLAFLRARNFRLTLKDGIFHLQHGSRSETFSVEDVTQACVVRPGTVGATEGALGLKDGRMLTLDTCLSDLHALGVVMDLRFREEFPPSADDLAKIRRDKLRKIRGLS
ncbi:MAG TPA: hypothetical protein VEK08_17930 [Planctomycetota bacterium]|nr:hypothetical protein [Planctomycetota bacterium]